MNRELIVLALGLSMASCGQVTPGQSHASTQGVVTGTVMLRACGGAYRPDANGCRPSPMNGATVSFSRPSSQSVKTLTDSKGRYLVRLLPGSYLVDVNGQNGSNKLSQLNGGRQVTVVAGQTKTLDLTFTIELL